MERDRQTVRPGGVTSEGGVSTGDGVRGQQMRAGRGVDDVVQQMTQVIAPRDRVRWGPIWAGLLSALSLWLLGNVLALAIGASSVEPGVADAGTAARITGWAPPILGLLAFLFGGWVAARTAAVRGTANGVFNSRERAEHGVGHVRGAGATRPRIHHRWLAGRTQGTRPRR